MGEVDFSRREDEGPCPACQTGQTGPGNQSDRSQPEHLVPPADGAAAHPLLPQLYYPQALSIYEVMAPFYAWAS